MDAVRSVLDQTLDRKYYEVIVIKNFVESQLDDFIDKNCEKKLYFESPNYGASLKEALSQARGEVICLLEDDDLFKKEKLEYVFKLFSTRSNLVYYHHPHILMEEGGMILNSNEKEGTEPDHNGSSIMIRKDLLLNVEWLDKIKISLDSVLYYLALDSGKEVLADGEKLSSYRVRQVTGDMNALIELRGGYLKKMEHDLSILKSRLEKENTRIYVDNYLNSLRCTYYPMLYLRGIERKVTIQMIVHFLLGKRFPGQRINLDRLAVAAGDMLSCIPINRIKKKLLFLFYRAIFTRLGQLSE
jgi:glycosyltransferase involved in cell wall biosynthesis